MNYDYQPWNTVGLVQLPSPQSGWAGQTDKRSKQRGKGPNKRNHGECVIKTNKYVYICGLKRARKCTAAAATSFAPAEVHQHAHHRPEATMTYHDQGGVPSPWITHHQWLIHGRFSHRWTVPRPCCRSPRWRSAGHPWRSHSTAQAPRGCRPCLNGTADQRWTPRDLLGHEVRGMAQHGVTWIDYTPSNWLKK